ncbi:MAG TPA: DotU family type IV/VI secretion system protein [Bryobacteraceae bacterium]|nr:DotU family type IV/VI secretion system protein [Bryobacteraceae bacterium]
MDEASSKNTERLALLYEGLMTAIVRVQSSRQQLQNSEAFRTKMKDALNDIAQIAARRGYAKEDIQEANFAVIAFLDEAVLSSQDPARTQWARKSMQEELFDQRNAGELFFKRLDSLRAHGDSLHLAEVLEVYYLCLLLGYEGRYAVGSKAELHLLMDNLRERIERIFGRNPDFSPDGKIPDAPPVTAPVDPLPRQLKLAAVAALALALLCFGGYKWYLSAKVESVADKIEQILH